MEQKKSDRVFSFIPDPEKDRVKYSYFIRAVNRSLSKISETLELKENISTRSVRYIFRTTAGELLIHDLIVMKLQGHTPEGVTYSYQGIIPKEKIDEMHKKIIDFLFSA